VDGARTAVVLGGSAAAWFAWAGADAPEPLATLVGVGSGIALAVALVAAHLAYLAYLAYLASRTRGAPSAVATDPAAHRRYGAVIAVETLLCAAGAVALGAPPERRSGSRSGSPRWWAATSSGSRRSCGRGGSGRPGDRADDDHRTADSGGHRCGRRPPDLRDHQAAGGNPLAPPSRAIPWRSAAEGRPDPASCAPWPCRARPRKVRHRPEKCSEPGLELVDEIWPPTAPGV
jgi:hypothetical protein